jgi:hypothetical protein
MKANRNLAAKIESSLAAGDFYQAHQVYKTLVSRHIKHHETSSAIAVLFDGCQVMLKGSQIQSAFDLMDQLLTLQKDQGQIAKLFRLCPDTSKPDFVAKVSKHDKTGMMSVFGTEYYRLGKFFVH